MAPVLVLPPQLSPITPPSLLHHSLLQRDPLYYYHYYPRFIPRKGKQLQTIAANRISPEEKPHHLISTNKKNLNPGGEGRGLCLGISANMWWADLRSAVGQRFNPEGIISFGRVMIQNPQLALPHVMVPDIRWIDWAELRKRGFRGVVFDKDNTITVPYILSLWPPLKASIDQCKAVFGDDNVAVFSNSAGLFEFDPDGSKAEALEGTMGIKVIRHRVKKPAGDAVEIEEHFGCSSSDLVMVGDRYFTDIVYGNRNGFLTVLTRPLSKSHEPFVVRQVRWIEELAVNRLSKKGLKPTLHSSGFQDPQYICTKQNPKF